MRVADLIVDELTRLNVDTFFGVPGGPISPMFDAVILNDHARLVSSRHETHAAFEAMGYYHSTRRASGVLVTAGPGATNVLTGLVSAHLEQIPMILIVGDVAWDANNGRLLQDSGPKGLNVDETFSKYARMIVRISSTDNVKSIVSECVSVSRDSLNPGPVVIVISINHSNAIITKRETTSVVKETTQHVDRHVIEHVKQKLLFARHPLLILGGALKKEPELIRYFVDVLGIPFVTTPRAKGIVSEFHQLSLRNGGLAASHWARNYVKQGVDVALALGTDLDDCSIGPTRYVTDGELIHVDINQSVFGRNLPTKLGLVADSSTVIKSLIHTMKNKPIIQNDFLVNLKKTIPFSDFSGSAQQIEPAKAIIDIEKAFPGNARFITDIGEHMLFALHYLTAQNHDSFTIHIGLGSMGSGICSAIGQACARELSTPVVCICGDGGMQMVGGEMLVAVKEQLDITFCVFNDSRYNMVHHGFKEVFKREERWDTPPIDFVMWAKSMNVPAALIEQPNQLTKQVIQNLGSGPKVLDIRIDRDVRFAGGGRNEALQHMSVMQDQNCGSSLL